MPLDPTDILDNGVVTNDHDDHTGRTPPSAGVDIDAPGLQEGSRADVRTPVGGTVEAVNPDSGFVRVRDGQGRAHEFVHLDMSEGDHVEQGTTVNAGDRIGALGNTGTTSDHVHYQVRDADDALLDPEALDPGNGDS